MQRYTNNRSRGADSLGARRLDSLSKKISDLYDKAVQNEKIFRHYQQFELQLLDQKNLDGLLSLLLDNGPEFFQLESLELWLFDPQNTLAELIPPRFLEASALRRMSSAAPLTSLYGSIPQVRLLSTQDGEPLPVFAAQALQSAALLPLMRQGVLVGSLHFGVKEPQRFTEDKSTDFINHLASVVAVCLENAVNLEKLQRLSMYDTLTQVKNRRAFQQLLDQELSRASRAGDSISLMMIDLDHFKSINDKHGHPMGDRVLKTVAQFVDGMVRRIDHLCRYGGEEFALILPNCGRQRAEEIAERIRQQVAELVVEDSEAEVSLTVTLSVGVCSLQVDQGASLDVLASKLLACADRGVYLSKSTGRNAVSYIPFE